MELPHECNIWRHYKFIVRNGKYQGLESEIFSLPPPLVLPFFVVPYPRIIPPYPIRNKMCTSQSVHTLSLWKKSFQFINKLIYPVPIIPHPYPPSKFHIWNQKSVFKKLQDMNFVSFASL